MAFCSKCGGSIEPENAQFCPRCGAPRSAPPVYTPPAPVNPPVQQQYHGNYPNQYPPQYPPQPYPPMPVPQLGMKWYKFLIYFSLFAAAVLDLINGFLYLTGQIYALQSAGTISPEVVYAMWGSLRALDVTVGILYLGLALVAIYTRFRLSDYRADGPTCLTIMYAAAAIVTLLYSLIFQAIVQVDIETMSSTITSLMTSIAMICVNHTYFRKRKALFTN